MEIWKDIKGYSGYYQVSNLGNIKSLERFVRSKNGKLMFLGEIILKPNIINTGYRQVGLNKPVNGVNTRRVFLVHRLVAGEFLVNPSRYPNINHKDGNKLNNRVENLEYCSQKHNMWHSINVLGNDHKNNNKDKVWGNNYNSTPVHQYSMTGEYIASFSSTTEAQDKTGVHRDGIYKVIKGKRINAGGFMWSYEKKDRFDIGDLKIWMQKCELERVLCEKKPSDIRLSKEKSRTFKEVVSIVNRE